VIGQRTPDAADRETACGARVKAQERAFREANPSLLDAFAQVTEA
jgi:hypothetical protein